ncbi:Cadmium-translocating P-type ATPase [Candidatus Arthromitus sp. SFB-mouse-SU]|uniref:heavy metal translocating P-type ATPase n=1 Tax=Candidatus Arthromitus sp. SFB-mouse TaxID=49118 RepID=UPI0002296889|nr:P-ATPase superfamily P-type ATPase cadmium transporter [Candidatus Arthromitus sp. SFB-mouse-NYU]EIA25045.1 Cadmium-translocating P-type ATPase [Candidatus Arthromitus sp. SFB-2]EIA27423.1 Cadmium-translocating P-type ATPase [Candidatus Arthromitus sp. SFB-co]EIA27504.1 Cadmium-translocating P-type ATPase [Candidatus Arthromitus sp. SFB-5]EIA30863.1 Cadmium-translocating P-type ATPase [Candidatus Arthromitus sp. SFB-mouse-SU]BAK79908.1 heavy metal translocating P-type ATPase [Candidatus Art
MNNHTLKFKNMNCYECAGKIKNELLKLSYISKVDIDVLTQNLNLEFKDTLNINQKLQEIMKLCIQIEPDMSFNTSNHLNESKNKINSLEVISFSIGIILFIISFFIKESELSQATHQTLIFKFYVCFASYLLIGFNILKKAVMNIKRGIIFDENALMMIATIGALIIGEFQEAVAVMIFSRVGEFIQDRAINKSRSSISSLMDIRPDTANLETNDSIKIVDPSKVKIGDIIVVKPGEKIPLDGEIIQGISQLDTKALTGEFLTKEVTIGDKVISGCINITSLIKIKVESEFKNSTVSRILNLVENANSKKSNTENFITKFSKIYTPTVIIIAFIISTIPPIILGYNTLSEWIYRALIFLVISCPCALVISIPLSFFSGIGVASKNGILIKASNHLEALNNLSTIVFDKTGTLTEGKFFITKVIPKNCEIDELIKYSVMAESFSNHPIAKSIIDYYNKPIDKLKIYKFEEIPGYGISICIDNDIIISGNKKMMDKFNINVDFIDESGTKVYVAKNNTYLGCILISDKIKQNSSKTIFELKKMNINNLAMLTGDNNKTAQAIADTLKITKVYSELLPDQKVKYVEELLSNKPPKSTLAFIGDGINDAPSLAMADIGISMGSIGSDAAIEASDIVLIDDDPYKIVKAIKIAKQTRTIAMQNIVLSLTVKILVIILGALGLSSMWTAILSDVGISLIVILNSVRILKNEI